MVKKALPLRSRTRPHMKNVSTEVPPQRGPFTLCAPADRDACLLLCRWGGWHDGAGIRSPGWMLDAAPSPSPQPSAGAAGAWSAHIGHSQGAGHLAIHQPARGAAVGERICPDRRSRTRHLPPIGATRVEHVLQDIRDAAGTCPKKLADESGEAASWTPPPRPPLVAISALRRRGMIC